ncbi:hypothetical protein NCC49_003741 [Naganishia albida]|nr:hypothetical protein NCC49_003741 [Naganishia albida]
MPNLGYTQRKFNARETDPNPSIKHISILRHKPNPDKALAIMKAVAAQMKRIMEGMKLVVNSFEEYPHNKVVLAGRNWNHGEVIELVIRKANGTFLPLYYLLNVMCHELAHIQQMNHGPLFKKLDNEIKRAVRAERARGYYGDGFYSSGIHLATGITVESDPLTAGEAPEYICGGAADRKAPGKNARTGQTPGGRKRLRAGDAGFTVGGAQTAKRRKAGSSNTRAFEGREDAIRIDGSEETSKDELKRLKALVKERAAAFRQSEGFTIKKAEEKALNSLTSAERRLIETSTHGKRANTANARDARAAHFERLLAAKTESKPVSEDTSAASSAKEETADSDSDAPENEEELDDYAQGFLAEMDEDERKVARGDAMDFFGDTGVGSDKPKSRSSPFKREEGNATNGSSSAARTAAGARRVTAASSSTQTLPVVHPPSDSQRDIIVIDD